MRLQRIVNYTLGKNVITIGFASKVRIRCWTQSVPPAIAGGWQPCGDWPPPVGLKLRTHPLPRVVPTRSKSRLLTFEAKPLRSDSLQGRSATKKHKRQKKENSFVLFVAEEALFVEMREDHPNEHRSS